MTEDEARKLRVGTEIVWDNRQNDTGKVVDVNPCKITVYWNVEAGQVSYTYNDSAVSRISLKDAVDKDAIIARKDALITKLEQQLRDLSKLLLRERLEHLANVATYGERASELEAKLTLVMKRVDALKEEWGKR